MLIRVLIVLLAVLNLGVALWWLTRPAPLPPQPPALPSGVAQLQLVQDSAPAPAPASVPAAPDEPATTAPAIAGTPLTTAADPPSAPASPAVAAAPAQCFSLGPFAEAGLAVAAAERLKGHVQSAKPRTLPGASASGYRVLMPAAESREAAQAVAQRIGAAGFDDFLVINNGEEANSIALGRYRSREAALRRQASLRAAGFAAQLLPIGREAAPQWWLDVALSGSGDAAQLRQLAASTQSMPLDCAALR